MSAFHNFEYELYIVKMKYILDTKPDQAAST